MTSAPEPLVTETVSTPVGDLEIATDPAGAVVALAFHDHFERVTAPLRTAAPERVWRRGTTGAGDALRRYVAGDLHALDGLEVAASGTDFRRRVWAALRDIPVGTTCSYGDIASAIGAPGAVRAVGSANGANPVWLIVPCHRVVRSDGGLGGYGGGVDRKEWLLAHEGADPRQRS